MVDWLLALVPLPVVRSLSTFVERRGLLAAGSLAAVPPAWTGTALDLVSIDGFDAPLAPFARYPDPVLRVDAAAVVRYDDKLRRVAEAVAATGRRVGAVGLAATQCAVDARLVVLGRCSYVNPRIIGRSAEADMVVWRESCLVLPPDVVVETLRDKSIVVEANDLLGRTFRRKLVGELARAFQHEYDHMRGILILDHAYDVVSSSLFPHMADLEAPNHDRRRRRAWGRGEVI